VPAAAVIPAPIAYAKVVAVKKLVVGRRAVGGEEVGGTQVPSASLSLTASLCCGVAVPLTGCWRGCLLWAARRLTTRSTVTLTKVECSKRAVVRTRWNKLA
jgi:hypothetical protein